MSGVNIVGVQFRRAGKIYDFHGKDFLVKLGDKVVVETERGPSLAEVKRLDYALEGDQDFSKLKPILRIANRKDLDSSGRLSADDATKFAKEKIKALNLDMRVINVEIQFGGNKIIIYFSAPGRVDFRELVKELAGGLKTRVELKQVGARDEAKLAGGIGICGREFCCSSFLREFVPVSIKMAKNQNLALNPSKVSGGCGRLLCCLTYEDETYKDLRQKLLPKGARVRLSDGSFGDVIKGDILNQVMLLEMDSGEQRSVPISELEVVEKNSGVEDDWADDLDFDGLMNDDDLAQLDDSEQVSRQRESRPDDRSSRRKPSSNRRSRDQHRSDSSSQASGPRGSTSNATDSPESRSSSSSESGQKRPRRRSNRRSRGGKKGGNPGAQGGNDTNQNGSSASRRPKRDSDSES